MLFVYTQLPISETGATFPRCASNVMLFQLHEHWAFYLSRWKLWLPIFLFELGATLYWVKGQLDTVAR